jgi:hypothetical protein
MAAGGLDSGRAAGDGGAGDLDGARRLAARRRAAPGRGEPRGVAARAPSLNSRMLGAAPRRRAQLEFADVAGAGRAA